MRLKDISILTPQYTGKPLDTEVSFVPMESLRNGNIDLKEIPYKDAKGKYTFFENGDLLIAKVTPCFENGNIAIANNLKEGIGFGSSEIFVLRFNKNALNTYMFYVSQSAKFQDAACATMCGVGGLKRISPLFMKTYEIDMPSISEQQRIVEYLDEKTKAIDGRISVLEKKSDAYTRLKASVINRAVTRGLNPNVTLKDSGIEWIGMIPEHWEIKRYKEFITLQKGKTPKELSYESVGLPYLTMDYLRDRDGKSTVYPESVEGLLEISANEIIVLWDGANAGEFIKSKAGYLGSTMALLLTKGISKNYLYYFLKSIERDSKYYSNGTTIPHFDSGILLNREYPVPPYSEQQAIANYLDAKCSEIDKAIENIDKQIDALNRLKRSLINEVVTGKRKV